MKDDQMCNFSFYQIRRNRLLQKMNGYKMAQFMDFRSNKGKLQSARGSPRTRIPLKLIFNSLSSQNKHNAGSKLLNEISD